MRATIERERTALLVPVVRSRVPIVMPEPPDRDAARPSPATLREVVAAVFWSFFGVRKGRSLASDAARIRPQQVILVGVAMAALLVVLLIVAVRLIVRVAG